MGWIGCARCENSRRNFVALTFALIALVHPVLHRVSCSYETIPNAPKHYAMHQNMSFWCNWADWCACCENSRSDFVALTFALIAQVHTVLHRVSCSYETIPNIAKHYATHQNMSLWSNGAEWVRSFQKIPMWLRGTNFCINCTSRPCFAPSFRQLRNDPKCSLTLCNTPKHEFRVQWTRLSALVAKNPDVISWHEFLH
jgi:hypothetical protein